jgi:hypothetical protein
LTARFGPSIVDVGGVGFVTTSVQHRRVLDPVVSEFDRTTGAAPTIVQLPGLSGVEVGRAWSRASRLNRVLEKWALLQGVSLPAQVRDVIFQSAVLLGRASRAATLDSYPQALVVGTQHNSAERAVLHAAIVSGRATVYVPHAPVADNPMYEDLPTHWAILRGPAEVDWYRDLGAGRSMLVGGDPSIASKVPDSIPRSRQVVYAAGADPSTVRQDVQLICSAGLQNVTYCPHPRYETAIDGDAAFPTSWLRGTAGSTFDELRTRGAIALIQRGSGVGLEALRLGLPVIDLRSPGSSAHYPYLRSPLIEVARNGEDLAVILSEVQGGRDRDRERRDYATTWSAFGGVEAASVIAEQIGVLSRGEIPHKLVLDGWA